MNPPWFDRSEILSALTRRVESFLDGYRQNLALLGPESVGKTTLMKRLLQQRFSSNPSPLCLYVEIRAEETLLEWASRFIQTLLYRFLQVKAEEAEVPETELSPLLLKASSWIPKASAAAKRVLHLAQTRRAQEAFDLIWDVPYLLTQESESLLILALDEFQRLEKFPVKDPYRRLGQKIMVHPTIQYLALSSEPAAARSILREGLSLLFGKFETIEIGPLEPTACAKAIRSIWSEGKVDPFLEHLLMELSQRTAGALDLLLQGIIDLRLTDPSQDPARILLDLLEFLFLDPQGILRRRFEAQVGALPIHRNRPTWLQVLTAVSEGRHRIEAITQALDRSAAQIQGALRVLRQSSLVIRQGSFHRIPDRLFQLWMRISYPILQGVELTSPASARACFRDAAWSWLAEVRETLHQSIEKQVLRMIQIWRGERVDLEGRQIHLPPFQRVEGITDEQTGRPLLLAHRAGRCGKSWLFLPWNGPLPEAGARDLVQGILKKRFKDYRKVLIGAHPVEMNARLILQQARIRLWDLPILNRLLDLYGLVGIPLPSERPVSWVPVEEIPREAGGTAVSREEVAG